jgi:hypothetical protein
MDTFFRSIGVRIRAILLQTILPARQLHVWRTLSKCEHTPRNWTRASVRTKSVASSCDAWQASQAHCNQLER